MSALETARAAAEKARALVDALEDVADFGEDAFADLKQSINTVFNTLAPFVTPPADDVREALIKTLGPILSGTISQIADAILAAFEVRPRGPVTDAEVEYEYTGRQQDGSPDWERIRNQGSAKPGAPLRRRKAGAWESNPNADSAWKGA